MIRQKAFGPQSGPCQRPQPQRGLPNVYTLQDSSLLQAPEFVGLIYMITGSTLQEEIEATGRRLILQGQNILGLKSPGTEPSLTMPVSYDPKTSAPAGPTPPSASEL